MGSVGSSTHASSVSQPHQSTSVPTAFVSLLGSGSASNGYASGSKSSQSASSGSSASMVEYKDVDSRLAALEKSGIEFSKVEIYKSPLQLTGVGNHHGLIYHYEQRLIPLSLVGGPSHQVVELGAVALRIDWGQDGLSFCDLSSKHAETVLKVKQCGLTPATLLEHINSVRDEEYNLLRWNCQHFSRHLFEQASGNWHLNTQLNDLQNTDATITAVTVYEKDSDLMKSPEVPSEDVTPNPSEPVVGLIYWYKTSALDEATGIQIEWVPGGLGFGIIIDASTVGKEETKPFRGTARNCGLKPVVVSLDSTPKLSASQGILNAQYVSATPGIVKRFCTCGHKPKDILEHLREVEGKAYQACEWNSERFVSYMWERILKKGSLPQLLVRLVELTSRDVAFTGLQEVALESPILQTALVYSYMPNYSQSDSLRPSQKDSRTVYMKLVFDMHGIHFEEKMEFVWEVKREKVEIRKARKANIKVRLTPSELQQQLAEIDSRPYETSTWSASDFCNYLFEKMPGAERAIAGV